MRRLVLGMKQKDMILSIGIPRQQYQQLELKGNPRLNTLELVSRGFKSEKVNLVKEFLESDAFPISAPAIKASKQGEENTLANDPWKHLLGDDE